MNILSIQSQVAYGHVGNSVAAFALQRLGHEVWAVPTALLSNHPGYGQSRGAPVAASLVGACVEGIAAIGALTRCDGVLTGYLTTPEIAEAALGAAQQAKSAHPAAIWCCDPVFGDHGRIYARPGLMEFFRDRAVPEADIVTPNLFELETLTGAPVADLAGARAAMAALAARGPSIVVLTSFDRQTPADALDVLALADGRLLGVRVPRVPRAPRAFEGAGDLFAALFLAAFLETREASAALESACASVAGVLAETERRNDRELALVAAQTELARPSRRFAVQNFDF